jgi:hypothetical protein
MPEQSRGPSPALVTGALVLVGFGLVLLAAGLTGPVDAGTISLAVCGASLVYALRRLYAVVRALARPDALAQVGRGAGHFSQAELRDEKRRLLRAIKELEFDHGMGKLSQQDFDAVIGTYRLRAIEVMRSLDGGELHPELRRLLAERDQAEAAAASTTPSEPAAPTAPAEPAAPPVTPTAASLPPSSLDKTSRICPTCTAHNDNDARFCKACGAQLARKADPPREKRGGMATSGEIGA